MEKPNKSTFDLAAATEKLKDPVDAVRMGALAQILAAGAAPDALGEIAECLKDHSERVRRSAVAVLGEIGPATVSSLTSALDEQQPCAVRMLAASVLARAGEAALPGTHGLIECLGSNDHQLRQVAALALSKIGTAVLPILRQSLSNSNRYVRVGAAEALGHVGPAASDALGDLQKISASEAPLPLRIECAAAALKISRDSQDALALMLKVLSDGDEPIRLYVLEKLGECRSHAEKATSAVLQCLADKSPEIRANAALAWGRICSHLAEATRALVPLLTDREASVRLGAVTGLSGFGALASGASPQLADLQKDTDSRVSAAATAALARIGGSAG